MFKTLSCNRYKLYISGPIFCNKNFKRPIHPVKLLLYSDFGNSHSEAFSARIRNRDSGIMEDYGYAANPDSSQHSVINTDIVGVSDSVSQIYSNDSEITDESSPHPTDSMEVMVLVTFSV